MFKKKSKTRKVESSTSDDEGDNDIPYHESEEDFKKLNKCECSEWIK